MAVTRIDPQTNQVAATIAADGIQDYGKLAVGEGAVWFTHDISKVSRIDPTTNQVVATIDVGPGVRGIAVGGGRVWVTREPQSNEIEGYLVQIDPATKSVVGDPAVVGVGPGPVTYGGGAVWVTLTDTGALVKIDPVTMAKAGEVDGVSGVAGYVDGEIWAATDQSVVEIDPSTSTVVKDDPISRPPEVDFGSDAAWVLTETGSTSSEFYEPDPQQPSTVVEVDPRSGESVGVPLPVGYLPAYAVGEGAVWVAEYGTGTITRIDPQP
jgi:streptogramin lyase